MIEANNLCFDYPGKRALDRISFSIEPNSITALVGPNGAGKTTLLRCLSALETPMSGIIKMNALDTVRYPRQVHEICSYLSDFFGLYDDLTVEQSLKFFAWSHNCKENATQLVKQAAKRLNIWEYKNLLAGKLSRGLRQRLAIAQTILHNPKILLLDEPASGLDPEARFNLSKLLTTLQKEGMTLIVSSHILAELEDYSTHMMVLQEGKLIKHCALRDYQREKNKVFLKVTLTEEGQKYDQLLKTIPHIIVKSMEKNEIMIELTGDQNAQKELLKALIDNQIPVVSIQEEKLRMQDVYLDVSKEKKAEKKSDKKPRNK